MNISLIGLLVKLGHINPAIFDAIFPHGPAHIAVSSAEASELNPQPIPPGKKLQLASVEVAQEIARCELAEASGNPEAATIVSRAVEEWCGNTPKRFPIPWPSPWPFPWPPDPEEEFKPDGGTSQVIGALTLASIASRMADGEIRDALDKGAEQLLEVGLAG